MEEYLRTCAVAGSVRTNLWNVCRPNLGHNIVTDDEEEDSDDDGEIMDGYAPLLGVSSNIAPSIWFSSLMMSAYLDCGIHLVFHGIVSYCVERMDEFMATHGLTQKFERLVNVYLVDIQSLRLDWCKMKFFQRNSGSPRMSWHLLG